MRLRIITFKPCPYTQMATLMCLKNNLQVEMDYINPKYPPSWFSEISPLDSVPIMQINGEIIFDSRTIVELLNDFSENDIHPKDALQRAKNRAWMSFGVGLLDDLFKLTQEKNQAQYTHYKTNLSNKLNKVAQFHSGKAYFNGQSFSVIEVGFTPFLMRLHWINRHTKAALAILPQSLYDWQQRILKKDYVKHSIADDSIEDIFLANIEQAEGILATLITDE